MVEVSGVPYRGPRGGTDPPMAVSAPVRRAPRSVAGPGQAARVAAFASLVRSGAYQVPGLASDATPLRAYRRVDGAD